MELIGGLAVLLVMALLGMTICAGGLCADKDANKDTPHVRRG